MNFLFDVGFVVVSSIFLFGLGAFLTSIGAAGFFCDFLAENTSVIDFILIQNIKSFYSEIFFLKKMIKN